jgi:hypothetical protein
MNRDYSHYFTRRNIILVVIAFFLLIIGLYVSTIGFVVVHTDQAVTLNISNINNTYQATDHLSAHSQKFLILKTGSYSITATSPTNQKTLYQLVVNPLLVTSIKTYFTSQKQATGLGTAEPACSALTQSSNVADFFPCANSGSGNAQLMITSNGQDFASLEDQISTLPGSVIPYGDGLFLLARKDEGSTDYSLQKVASSVNNDGTPSIALSTTKTPPQLTSNSTLITDQSVTGNERFVIKNANTLFVFKNTSDTSGQEIDLSRYVASSSHFYIQTMLVGNKIYVYAGALDASGDAGTAPTLPQPQRFYIFNADSGALLHQYTVADSMRLSHVVVSSSGQVAAEGRDLHSTTSQFYLVTNGALSSQKLFNYATGTSCWAGNALYFISNDNKGIYQFDPTTSSSYLVYSSRNHLANLECLYQKVYFNAHPTGDSAGVYPYHLVLTNQAYDSRHKRPENIFPLDGEQSPVIALADYYKSSVKLVLYGHYNAAGVCSVQPGYGQDEAVAYLAFLGLDTKAFGYNVMYQCASVTGQ